MKTALLLLALFAVISQPARADDSDMAKGALVGCGVGGLVGAGFVGAVALAHRKDMLEHPRDVAYIATVTAGGTCGTGAYFGALSEGMAAEAPTQQDLQANPDSDEQ